MWQGFCNSYVIVWLDTAKCRFLFKRNPTIASRQSFESGLHGLSTTESLDKIRTENEESIPREGMRTVGEGRWGRAHIATFNYLTYTSFRFFQFFEKRTK